HALQHPWLTWRYARLAGAEARLVGARRAAGVALSLWRRVHLAVAFLFLCGMALHIVLVTFFAGYVAKGRAIYWWHLAAWGGGHCRAWHWASPSSAAPAARAARRRASRSTDWVRTSTATRYCGSARRTCRNSIS